MALPGACTFPLRNQTQTARCWVWGGVRDVLSFRAEELGWRLSGTTHFEISCKKPPKSTAKKPQSQCTLTQECVSCRWFRSVRDVSSRHRVLSA
eukprot:3556346-Rhodomonas_salina.6